MKYSKNIFIFLFGKRTNENLSQFIIAGLIAET